MNDAKLPPPDTPDMIESRMRTTRAAFSAHVDLASRGVAERTRSWPMWLVGSAALAGLAMGLARGPRGTQSSPSRKPAAAKAAGWSVAALIGWAVRITPLVRSVLRQLRAQPR